MKLDIEVATPPAANAPLSIVSIAEQKVHMRVASVSSTTEQTIEECVRDAVSYFHGPTGVLNRTIMPMTWRMYLRAFPTCGLIEIPFPPLTGIPVITYRDAAGATQTFATTNYIVRTGTILGEVEKLEGVDWPETETHPRAVTIEFTAGWAAADVPPALKRLIKMYAAHLYENREVTMAEPRTVMVNRKVEFAFDHLFAALAVPLSYGDP